MGKISEFFNFDNIGGKIKNVAKWSCWITILLIWIAAPIAFIALVANDWTAYLCWIPLVGAIVGPVIIWLGSWAMYAFGEFVEDVHAIRNKEASTTEGKIKREAEEKAKKKIFERTTAVKATENTPQPKGEVKNEEATKVLPCPECGEDLDFMGWSEDELKETQTCPMCGKKIVFNQ